MQDLGKGVLLGNLSSAGAPLGAHDCGFSLRGLVLSAFDATEKVNSARIMMSKRGRIEILEKPVYLNMLRLDFEGNMTCYLFVITR